MLSLLRCAAKSAAVYAADDSDVTTHLLADDSSAVGQSAIDIR